MPASRCAGAGCADGSAWCAARTIPGCMAAHLRGRNSVRPSRRYSIVFRSATRTMVCFWFGTSKTSASGQVVLGQQRPLLRVANVAAEARGACCGCRPVQRNRSAGRCTRRTCRCAASRNGARAVAVARHPEDVEIADLVVGAAGRHRRGVEFDFDRALRAGRNHTCSPPVRRCRGRRSTCVDARRLLGFDVPVVGRCEIFLEEQRALGGGAAGRGAGCNSAAGQRQIVPR